MYKKNEWMIAEKKDNYIIALLHFNATAEEGDKNSYNARDKEPRWLVVIEKHWFTFFAAMHKNEERNQLQIAISQMHRISWSAAIRAQPLCGRP